MPKLVEAYARVLAKADKKGQEIVPKKVVKDRFSVHEQMEHILNLINMYKEMDFVSLFEPDYDKNDIVTTFLAMLELLKYGKMRAVQDDIFGNIKMYAIEGASEEPIYLRRMMMENIKQVVESVIFSSGTPISKKDIIEKIPELVTSELNKIIKDLKKKYSGDNGILLMEFNGKLQFSSNPKYGDIVADILTPLKEKSLTKTLLEVLSTVAYKQPITRLEIDDMRGGTNSEYAISGLLKAGLIEPIGRKDTVGRPLLYGTTDNFLKKFEIESLEELPDLIEVMEKIQLIYQPPQDSLFHNRTLYDEEGNLIEENQLEEVASDIVDENLDQVEEINEEIPEFLDGEEYQVIG